MTFFWAALSKALVDFLNHSLAEAVSPLAMASLVFLMALLKAPLILAFFVVFLAVTRIYFLADFLIGINLHC